MEIIAAYTAIKIGLTGSFEQETEFLELICRS